MSTTSLYIVNATDSSNGALLPSLTVDVPENGTAILVREYVGPLRLETVTKLISGLQQELAAYAVNTVAVRLDLKTST